VSGGGCQRENRPGVDYQVTLPGMAHVVRQFLRGQVDHGHTLFRKLHEECGSVDACQQSRLSGRQALHFKQLHSHCKASFTFELRRSLLKSIGGQRSSSEFQHANVSGIAVLDNGLVSRSEHEAVRPRGSDQESIRRIAVRLSR